jgi:hypothetical protein
MNMDTPDEAILELSFPKALLSAVVLMACFIAGLFFIGIPMQDPLLRGFLVVMVVGITAVCPPLVCVMLRCKINHEGLWPAMPVGYQGVFRWDDMTAVDDGFNSVFVRGPFYLVRGRKLGEFCLLPRAGLLKDPDSLKRLIDQYAPADNIVRRKLVN